MITASKIYKIRIVFSIAYAWDHKRVVAVLRDMILSSGLPYEPAKINKNWPRLAYGPVLGYGQTSLSERADLYFSAPVKEAEVQARLTASAPDGVCVLRVRRVPYALPSVSQLAEVVQYRAEGDFSVYTPTCTAEAFFSSAPIYITVQAANGMMLQRDIKSFIVSVKQTQPNQVSLLLQKRAEQWVKPEEVLAAWLQVPVPMQATFALPGIKFIREELYWRDQAGTLHVI